MLDCPKQETEQSRFPNIHSKKPLETDIFLNLLLHSNSLCYLIPSVISFIAILATI